MTYQHWIYKCPTTHYKGCGHKMSIDEWFLHGEYNYLVDTVKCPKCKLIININKLESCEEEVKIVKS